MSSGEEEDVMSRTAWYPNCVSSLVWSGVMTGVSSDNMFSDFGSGDFWGWS